MIDPNNPKSSLTLNRSYTIHNSSTDYPNPSPNSSSSSSSPSINRSNSLKGRVKQLCNLFESRRATNIRSKLKLSSSNSSSIGKESKESKESNETYEIRLPGTEDRVVIYFTSLRGIRRTYEDCYTVRTILKFFNVFIDERDVSMDSAYRTELLTVLREKQVSLPQVFIKGKYVGGVEVIKQLHETGQLAKALTGVRVRLGSAWQVCDACGDVRFVPCGNCSGSKKVFDEEDDERLVRCVECNENGLVRCPVCSS